MTITIGSKESVNLRRLMGRRKVGGETSHREDYLESAYWHFDESRKSVGERLAFKASLLGEITKYENRVRALEEELETERMRLAACGVVSLANTPESASKAREMLPKYNSASCQDVARVVDENIRLRKQLELLGGDD